MSHSQPPLADITNRLRQEANIPRNPATTPPAQHTTQHAPITQPNDTANDTLSNNNAIGQSPHQEEF